MIILIILLSLLLIVNSVFANQNKKNIDNCFNLIEYTKYATKHIYNIPYWYMLGLYKTESNCKWVTSLDGFGSIGYGQITVSMWDKILKPIYPNYKEPSQDHFNASVYIIKSASKGNPCNKLWATFQAYNGGTLVYKEIKRANSCKYEEAKQFCKRKDICVWVTPTGCRQYRNACDINYSYSIKIYNNSQKYIDKNCTEFDKNISYW